MADIVEVEFRKGSVSMFYKTTFKENEYTEVDFFMSKYKHTYNCFPERKRQDNRGITFKKKEGILKLLRVEPDRSKVLFWHKIIVNDKSVDLMYENELKDRSQKNSVSNKKDGKRLKEGK